MNTTAPPEPVLFQLWFRPTKSGRWAKVGRYSTRAEAVNAIGGKGEWWVKEQRVAASDAGNLFPDDGSTGLLGDAGRRPRGLN